MKFKVYSQGELISDKLPFDAYSFKDIGIFETMRTYEGKIFREEEHLKRLLKSAKTSGYPYPVSLPHIRKEIKMSLKHSAGKDVAVRLLLFNGQSFVMVGTRTPAKKLYDEGVRLRTSPVRRSLSNAAIPEAKTSAYHNSLMASLEPRSQNIYEWVLLDRRGYVTEVQIGNLFMVTTHRKRGKEIPLLKTPPLDGILNGVTRRFVIECASQEGIDVYEDYLTRHEIFNAKEAFLTNTSWEILPIRELDGRKIGNQIPGVITKKLHKRFKQRVRQECRRKR